MSSSNSPCAACKFLRRKCTQECVFAPYFPPDQPQKFANVHKVFGASNVSKILNELNTTQREDAVNSLAYEAQARLENPVYGCFEHIMNLQNKLKQVQNDLHAAKQELATYIGPSAMMPILAPGIMPPLMPYMPPMLNYPVQHQQQLVEAQQQQMAAREQQEMLRNYEQQHHGGDLARFNGGFDASGQVTVTGFSHMNAGQAPSLALGGAYDNNMYQIQQQPQHEQHHPHLQIQHEQHLQLQQEQHHHHHLQLQQEQQHHHHHHLQLQQEQHHHLQLQQEQHHHLQLQLQPQQLMIQQAQTPNSTISSEDVRSVGPPC